MDDPNDTILGPPVRPVNPDGTLDWPRDKWGSLDWDEIRRGLKDEFWTFVMGEAPGKAEDLWATQGPFTLQELARAIVKGGCSVPSLSQLSTKVRSVLEPEWHFRNYGPNAAVFTKRTWGPFL